MPDDILSAVWGVETLPSVLGWQSRAALRIRFRRGGHAEQTLRALAERVGALQPAALGHTMALVVALEPEDVGPCLDALAAVLMGRMTERCEAPTPRQAPAPPCATESVHMGQLMVQGSV